MHAGARRGVLTHRAAFADAAAPSDLDKAPALIDQTWDVLASSDPAVIEAGASRELAIEPADGVAFDMTGSEHAANWATPQFNSHRFTATVSCADVCLPSEAGLFRVQILS